MITITSHELIIDPLLGNPFYDVEFTIDNLHYNRNISQSDAETDGEWDGDKALAYLNAIYDELLASAREIRVEVITKRLEVSGEVVEAAGFVVLSPVVPEDPTEAMNAIKAEKEKREKSVDFVALTSINILGDLRDRMLALENRVTELEKQIAKQGEV